MELSNVAMKIGGVWMPKTEQHMLEWMTKGKKRFVKDGKITYQWQKQELAMKIADDFCPKWRKGVFVDVGGHCAYWSMWWGVEVARTIAYEPTPLHRKIYQANMPAGALYTLLPYALSDAPGELMMRTWPLNSGATRMISPKDGPDPTGIDFKVEVVTLDATLPQQLGKDKMTVLKIDCEGFEEKVVRGGEKVIRQHRPVIIVEQKFEGRHFDFMDKGAIAALEGWGFKIIEAVSGDHVMVHGDFL